MIERPGKIVAIGLNYMDHAKESGTEPPKRPLIFAKFPTAVINHEETIRIPRALTERVDWEVELAVVMGREASRVSEKDVDIPVYEPQHAAEAPQAPTTRIERWRASR